MVPTPPDVSTWSRDAMYSARPRTSRCASRTNESLRAIFLSTSARGRDSRCRSSDSHRGASRPMSSSGTPRHGRQVSGWMWEGSVCAGSSPTERRSVRVSRRLGVLAEMRTHGGSPSSGEAVSVWGPGHPWTAPRRLRIEPGIPQDPHPFRPSSVLEPVECWPSSRAR